MGFNPNPTPVFSSGTTDITGISGLSEALAQGSLDSNLYYLCNITPNDFTDSDVAVQLDKKTYLFSEALGKINKATLNDDYSAVTVGATGVDLPASIEEFNLLTIDTTHALMAYSVDGELFVAVVDSDLTIGTAVKFSGSENGQAIDLQKNGTDYYITWQANYNTIKLTKVSTAGLVATIESTNELRSL